MESKRKSKEGAHEKRGRKSASSSNVEDKEVSAALELLLNTNSQRVRNAVQEIVEKEIGSSDPFGRFSNLGSAITSAGQSVFREYSSKTNSEAWPFSEDMSAKIFSMLDTVSLMRVSATCTMWRKISLEPACYKNVDLTFCGLTIPSAAVTKILERASTHLRSLKLGLLHRGPQAGPFSFETPKRNAVPPQNVQQSAGGSTSQALGPGFSAVPYVDKALAFARFSGKLGPRCLDALYRSPSMSGRNVTSLHLYNISSLSSKSVCRAVAACQLLEDLEVVGLQVSKQKVMDCVGTNSPKLARLFFQPVKDFSCSYPLAVNQWSLPAVRLSTYQRLVSGCPNLSSLTLRDGNCKDKRVMVLLKGLSNLKDLDLSRADYLTGSFLQAMVAGGFAKKLEKLTLRDCVRLKETAVEAFLTSLVAGEMKHLRELDISNKNRYASSDEWFARRLGPAIIRLLGQLRNERPMLLLSAEYSHDSDSESLPLSDPSDDSASGSDMSTSSSSLLGMDEDDSDEDGDDEDEEASSNDDDDDDDEDDDDEGEGSEEDEEDENNLDDDGEDEDEDDEDYEEDEESSEEEDDDDDDEDDDDDPSLSEGAGSDEKDTSRNDGEDYGEDCDTDMVSSEDRGEKTVEGKGRSEDAELGDANAPGKEVTGCQERCVTNFARRTWRRPCRVMRT